MTILKKQPVSKVVAPGFTPASVPNLEGWWDVSDAANISISGGSLVQLNDKSGNGRNLNTADITLSLPTYSASGGPNNLPYIQFDGTHNLVYASANIFVPVIVYMLMRITSLTKSLLGGDYRKSICTFSGRQVGIVMDDSPSIGYAPWIYVNGSYNNNPMSYSNGQNMNWQVMTADFLSASPAITPLRFNNEPPGITCLNYAGQSGVLDLQFGASGFTAQYQLTECIIVGTSISQADDNAIRQYLLSKGSIAVKPQLRCYGDSLTAGFCDPSQNWPYLVCANKGLDIVNYGFGGTIVFPNNGSSGVAGQNFVDVYNNEFAYGPYEGQYGVFFFGVNDVNQGGINSAWKTTYQGYLQSLIDRGYDRSKMILVTPPSTTANAAGRATLNTYIADIATALSINHYDAFTDFNNNGGDSLFSDTLHPNAAGNVLEAAAIESFIT